MLYVLRCALGLFFVTGISCGGEDPVLRAARLAQEADVASGSAVESHAAGSADVQEAGHGGHPIDGGVAGNTGNGGVAGDHEEGVPGDPSIGRPDQPPPGQPGSMEAGEPGQPSLVNGGDSPPSDSEMVTLQGQILMSDYRHGDLRIDIFDGDHRSHIGQRPALVMSQTVSSTGPFSIQVPLILEEVWIEVSNDENGDGRPGPRDPSGLCASNPIDISNGLVSGLMIEIVRQEAPPGGVGAEL